MRALELDEKLAEAHASLVRGNGAYDWDWPGARREFERALELNPNTYMVLMMAVSLLACIVPTRRALAIEPMEMLRDQ